MIIVLVWVVGSILGLAMVAAFGRILFGNFSPFCLGRLSCAEVCFRWSRQPLQYLTKAQASP
jgi:hypothetical protein